MVESGETFHLEAEKARALNAFRCGWLAHQYSASISKKEKLPSFESIFCKLNKILVHPDEVKHREGAIPGQYRDRKVFLPSASFFPPLPVQVPKLMQEFVAGLDAGVESIHRGVASLDIPTILDRMAYSHYWLSRIHPFRDGNGRTSREVNNIFSLRFGLPQIFMGPVDRNEYIDALREVDKTADLYKLSADLRPLSLFFGRKLLRSFPGNLSTEKAVQKAKLEKEIDNLNFEITFDKRSPGKNIDLSSVDMRGL